MNNALIQVHYHLRPGGVSTVIKRYCSAFRALTGNDTGSYILCEDLGAIDIDPKNASICSIDECGYRSYNNRDEFISFREKIITKIECFLKSITFNKLTVVVHNMTLAKNLALTSAVFLLSQKLTSDTIQFFSVIHDFSEEGRVDLLDNIREVEHYEEHIKKQMYFCNSPVKLVVPNESSFDLLCKNNFNVSLVPNPVNCIQLDNVNIDRFAVKECIINKAAESGIVLSKEKKLAYYPVRLVSRKNIYEAITLSCIFLDSSLIAGPSGTGVDEIERYKNLNLFIKRHKLPIFTDVFQCLRKRILIIVLL